jgi:hypothetical protein
MICLENQGDLLKALLARAIAPDGSFLASVGEDNALIIWNLPRILNLDLLEYGCNWVGDYLRTGAEVEQGDRQICQ